MELKIVTTPTQGYDETLTHENWCVNTYAFKDLSGWLKFITEMEKKGADKLYLYEMSTADARIIHEVNNNKTTIEQIFLVRAQFKDSKL